MESNFNTHQSGNSSPGISIISDFSELKGELEIKGKLLVSGKITGNIYCTDSISVLKNGCLLTQEAISPKVLINGYVRATIIAKEVFILKDAFIIANITCESIRIEDGAFIDHCFIKSNIPFDSNLLSDKFLP